MPPQFTQQQFRDAYKALPEGYRNYLLGLESRKALEAFVLERHIDDLQAEKLYYLCDCVAYKLIAQEKFPELLHSYVEMGTEHVDAIVSLFTNLEKAAQLKTTTSTDEEDLEDADRDVWGTEPTQIKTCTDVVIAIRLLRTPGDSTVANAVQKLLEGETKSIEIPNGGVWYIIGRVLMIRTQALVSSLRSAILDQDYKHAVRNAVSGHVLSEAEFATLEEEVLMVLLGLQSKADFARDLQSQVPSLTAADAQRVAGHIESHFFALLSPYLDETTPHPSPLPRGEGNEVPPPSLPLGGGGSTTNTPRPSPQPSPAGRGGTTTTPLEQFIRKQADVQTRFEKLPEEVRGTILSSEVADAFGTVVRTHNLSQEQFTTLGSAIVRVLTGLATTKDFRATLPSLGIPADTHDALATEVERGMFKPVRDAIVLALASRKNDGVA